MVRPSVQNEPTLLSGKAGLKVIENHALRNIKRATKMFL